MHLPLACDLAKMEMLDNKELHHFLTNRLINCITSKLIMITKQAGMRHSITYSHNMINQLLIGTSSYHKLARTWSQYGFQTKNNYKRTWDGRQYMGSLSAERV